MATFDTTELLANTRRRAMASSASAAGTADADLLAILNEEMQTALVPAIMRTRAEYFVTYSDTALTSGTAAYDVPARAMGAKLREVQLISSTGHVRNLPQFGIEELHLWNGVSGGDPAGFYMRGNKVVLHPTPGSSVWSLRRWYFRRPNRLVLPSACMAITSLASAPTYAGTKPGTILTTTPTDVIRAVPHFDSLGDDLTPSAVVATTSVTYSAAVADVAVGDYVCLAGESCVPQLPAEWHPVLAQRGAARILQHKGSAEAQSAWELAAAMAESAIAVLAPRVDGEPQYLVNQWWW